MSKNKTAGLSALLHKVEEEEGCQSPTEWPPTHVHVCTCQKDTMMLVELAVWPCSLHRFGQVHVEKQPELSYSTKICTREKEVIVTWKQLKQVPKTKLTHHNSVDTKTKAPDWWWVHLNSHLLFPVTITWKQQLVCCPAFGQTLFRGSGRGLLGSLCWIISCSQSKNGQNWDNLIAWGCLCVPRFNSL